MIASPAISLESSSKEEPVKINRHKSKLDAFFRLGEYLQQVEEENDEDSATASENGEDDDEIDEEAAAPKNSAGLPKRNSSDAVNRFNQTSTCEQQRILQNNWGFNTASAYKYRHHEITLLFKDISKKLRNSISDISVENQYLVPLWNFQITDLDTVNMDYLFIVRYQLLFF